MALLLRRVVEFRRGERAPLAAAFLGFFSLLCGYYLLRPLRDALGIAGGTTALPWLFSATFIAVLALLPVTGALAARLPPQRFVPLVFRFFALNILVFAAWFASGRDLVLAGRVFFVWLSVYNLFVVSMFWSALADRFSAGQGRRLFGFIAAGGSAGALAGPALAAMLATRAGPALMALLAALLLELTVQCYRRLVRSTPARVEREGAQGLGGNPFNGVLMLLRDPYLAGIALYFLLHTLASTFLYLEQVKIIAASSGSVALRTQMFALVDLAVSLSSLLLQVFVTGRLIRVFGLGVSLAVLPLAGWLAFLGAAMVPTLAMMAAAQALRRACDYAISKPAREVLFTVISREAKYKAKSAIETVVYRGGDALSGWLFSLAVAAGAGLAALAWVMLPVSLAWAALSAWLARRQEGRAAMETPLAKEG